MKSVSALTLVVLGASSVFAAAPSLVGCFDSTDSLTFNADLQFNSVGSCSTACLLLSTAVFATANSSACYCGPTFPPKANQVDNSNCTTTCPGYPANLCGGGSKYTSVYLTGLTASADYADGSSSSSSSDSGSSSTSVSSTPSATKSTSPSVVTVVAGQTVTVAASTSSGASGSSSSSGGGTNKAAIAAGVVVGLVAIMAIAGGVFVFLRNKRRRDIEDEYKRNAAVSSFISSGSGKHPPSSGGGSSFTDMRLDPAVMAQRRMSDGSIADNQDYSRRILKVTNA